MKEKCGTEYLKEAQTRDEDLAKAESMKAGLATVVDIEVEPRDTVYILRGGDKCGTSGGPHRRHCDGG